MFWTYITLVTFLFAGTVSGLNLTCASFEAVSTLNAIVDTMSGFLQDIQTNSSIPMHERMSMILDTICNDLVLRKLVNGIAEDIAECPELILQSDLTSLELGPLSFLDLLETFESVDHVCECVDPLAQVMAIEDIRQDIIYENATLMAVFPEVINLNVICMKTSPPPRVNFTEAMLVILGQEEQCQAVFQHSTMDILRMEDFILNKCDSYIAEDFSCALNYAHDQEFNNCLKRVSDKMIKDLEDPKCGRVTCVTKSMADCEENGRNSYMQSVNIYEVQPQFQLSTQVCENSATSFASSFNWILLSSLISVLHH